MKNGYIQRSCIRRRGRAQSHATGTELTEGDFSATRTVGGVTSVAAVELRGRLINDFVIKCVMIVYCMSARAIGIMIGMRGLMGTRRR